MITISAKIAMAVPTPNTREQHYQRSRRVKRQRALVRRELDLFNGGPSLLPAVVTLVRVSTRLADTDRAALALAAVRDEVARWLCGVPFEVVDPSTGKTSTPRAPDGPSDPIEWMYGQEQVKTKGYQGVLIHIRVET